MEYARDWRYTVLHGRFGVVVKFAIKKIPLLNTHFYLAVN